MYTVSPSLIFLSLTPTHSAADGQIGSALVLQMSQDGRKRTRTNFESFKKINKKIK